MKKQYIGGNCLKTAWTVGRFKEGLSEKEGVVFSWGVDTSMHTMTVLLTYLHTLVFNIFSVFNNLYLHI